MPSRATVDIRQLGPADHACFEKLMTVFGEAFDEPDTYTRARPSRAYVERLLDNPFFIAFAAMHDDEVVGGIAAYELPTFERERSEIYVYDIAVTD